MGVMRVGVLMGGCSSEREVSLRTGEGVAAALRTRGHDVQRIVWGGREPPLYELLRRSAIDVAFLALHGRGGEDGCVQGMLELMGIPYTGSDVLGSALAMDKLKAKEMFRLHNVPTPPYYVIGRAELANFVQVHGSFGFPVVVKPRREGSSIGVAKADHLSELETALQDALQHDEQALVERHVRGTGDPRGRARRTRPRGHRGGSQIRRTIRLSGKIQAGLTETICPPRVPATRMRGVLNLGSCAARAVGCTGACRVDLMVTDGENEYVLEVNSLPGMTPTSLLPKIAESAGIDYPSLCEAILAGARLHAGLTNLSQVSSDSDSRSQGVRVPTEKACAFPEFADPPDAGTHWDVVSHS